MASLGVSVYLVLCCGNLFGGVVKGVTGFGSAIINLLVWVSAKTLGINAGTMQQAVCTEAVACMVVAFPLLLLTKAHKTSDWRLVTSLTIFVAAGSPLGAALLTNLDHRLVELTAAAILSLVIMLHVKVLQQLHGWVKKVLLRRSAYQPMKEEDATGCKASHVDGSNQQTVSSTHVSIDGQPAASHLQDAARDVQQQADDMLHQHTRAAIPSPCDIPTAEAAKGPSVDPPPAHLDEGCVCINISHSSNSTDLCNPAPRLTDAVAEKECIVSTSILTLPISPPDNAQVHGTSASPTASQSSQAHVMAPEQVPMTGPVAGATCNLAVIPAQHDDKQPLLCPIQQLSHEIDASKNPDSKEAVHGQGILSRPQACARCCLWLAEYARSAKGKELMRIFGYGSLAGTASGVMAGMTGMGGPPVMYMYDKLQVAKDVVRGTNAMCNLLQVRIISYIIMGVFKKEEIYLYVFSSIAGLFGVAIGHMISHLIDQKAFSNILVALMCTCCVLLLASGLGLLG